VAGGHQVVLHARDRRRAQDARAGGEAEDVLVGDLSSIGQTREVAEQANAAHEFDAVIHNAGIGYREPRRIETEDGLEHVFAINVLAPYLLTALIGRPRRLVYLSSGLHRSGSPELEDRQWERRWVATKMGGPGAAGDPALQDGLLEVCEHLTGEAISDDRAR
jgi:NAD(P)-dependent dehydrogenase (short-subunit alcohol dehydrogenase family)